MIYVYVAIPPGMGFRVVKGAHIHSEKWEKICAVREYVTTADAIIWETDLRVLEALKDIQLDEITATRRRLATSTAVGVKR